MTGEALQEMEMLAQDYVLGLLSPDEAAKVEAAMTDDNALRIEIVRLQEHFRELDLTAIPETVSDTLWTRIEGRLDDNVLLLDAGKPIQRGSTGRSSYWRGFASAAIAASFLFALITGAFFGLRQPPSEPLVIAILMDQDANPGVIVEALADDRLRVLPLVDISIPEGRVLEVWTLLDPEAGPVSLGLLEEVSEARLEGYELPRPVADQLYEISLEPEGGSPIGRPTGPVLFKGLAKVPF